VASFPARPVGLQCLRGGEKEFNGCMSHDPCALIDYRDPVSLYHRSILLPFFFLGAGPAPAFSPEVCARLVYVRCYFPDRVGACCPPCFPLCTLPTYSFDNPHLLVFSISVFLLHGPGKQGTGRAVVVGALIEIFSLAVAIVLSPLVPFGPCGSCPAPSPPPFSEVPLEAEDLDSPGPYTIFSHPCLRLPRCVFFRQSPHSHPPYLELIFHSYPWLLGQRFRSSSKKLLWYPLASTRTTWVAIVAA